MQMNYKYTQNNLPRSRATMIIIIVAACCAAAFIFSQTSLFQYRYSKYLMRVSTTSQTWMTQYSQDDIHLAFICAGSSFNEIAVAALKSIMFHRRKSYNITFHIFTDSDGEKILSKELNLTANVCTNFRFYQIEKLLKIGNKFLEKHQISNPHYSGIYALSKAFIHEVLPSNISHVLIIDADVLFVDDVYSVWKQFQLFKTNKTALGLVPWYPPVPIDYKYKGSVPDPFLTGVVLQDLNVCRSIGLTGLFDQSIDTAYKEFGLTSLWTADQVVLSLFATYFSKHVVALPCFVNGHTYHYLKDGSMWKSSCSGEYLRTIHVVPSSKLLKLTDYFGHLYVFFKEMPIEWLSHCGKKES